LASQLPADAWENSEEAQELEKRLGPIKPDEE